MLLQQTAKTLIRLRECIVQVLWSSYIWLPTLCYVFISYDASIATLTAAVQFAALFFLFVFSLFLYYNVKVCGASRYN